uniref:Uncharacterized protein n=1 Tax=Clytia hemisphaerica TaxID=252671 RepID=A0A7M6DQD3_9CNID
MKKVPFVHWVAFAVLVCLVSTQAERIILNVGDTCSPTLIAQSCHKFVRSTPRQYTVEPTIVCIKTAMKNCRKKYPNSKENRKQCRKEEKNKCQANNDNEEEFYACCQNKMSVCLRTQGANARIDQSLFGSDITIPVEFCYTEGDCHIVYVTYRSYTIV